MLGLGLRLGLGQPARAGRARLLLGLLLLVVRGDDAARLLRVLADLAARRDHGCAALRAAARQGAAAWLGLGLRVRVEG